MKGAIKSNIDFCGVIKCIYLFRSSSMATKLLRLAADKKKAEGGTYNL